MKLVVVTSSRSVSLQRVAHDIASVLRSEGYSQVRVELAPSADPRLYRDVCCAVVVFPLDPAWVTPYAYLARYLKTIGKKVAFYTTVEGRILGAQYIDWVFRDLTFVANSEYTREKIEEAGGRVDAVVHHGVDVDAVQSFRWKGAEMRSKLGLRDGDFVIGYIAAGYLRKGHELFAQVLSILEKRDPSIKPVVLTDAKGAEKYSHVEKAIIIPDFGKLSLDELYGLYHALDVYVHASLAEGFGLPVLEALAAGKPVVHADYAPLSEITTPSTSFRVRVTAVSYRRELGSIEYELHFYDPEEMASAILQAKEEVLRDRDYLSSKCARRARRFSASRVYKQFKYILESSGGERVGH